MPLAIDPIVALDAEALSWPSMPARYRAGR